MTPFKGLTWMREVLVNGVRYLSIYVRFTSISVSLASCGRRISPYLGDPLYTYRSQSRNVGSAFEVCWEGSRML